MIDPVSLIVTAIAVGAAAGLKPTVEQAVKDAYAGLKTLIQRKYDQVDLSPVEKKPDSTAKQESLKEDLTEAGAAQDAELAELAAALIEAVNASKSAKTTAADLKIDVTSLESGAVELRRLAASGNVGIKFDGAIVKESFVIEDVTAGKADPKN